MDTSTEVVQGGYGGGFVVVFSIHASAVDIFEEDDCDMLVCGIM